MSGFSDRLVILKIGDGGSPETFTAIAGLKDVTISESNADVDTTNKDDSGYRTLLDGRSLYSMTITGTGLFKDSQTIADVETLSRSGALNNFQIDFVSTDAATAGETLDGSFKITQFERSSANTSEVNYSITLASSGQVTSS